MPTLYGQRKLDLQTNHESRFIQTPAGPQAEQEEKEIPLC